MRVELSEGRIIVPFKKTTLSGVFDLKPFDNSQNGKQRRYYWKCLIHAIADYTGYTEQETHGRMGFMFLLDKTGKTPYVRSSESITAKEREVYHEDIRRFSSVELGLYLPLPNEYEQIIKQKG